MLVVGAHLRTERTLRMERLVPGAEQRPRTADLTAGGTAVTVCRAATVHGVRTRLVGNLPGVLGRYVGDLLDREGHAVRRVVTKGEIRSATIIVEDDLRVTVLDEPGPALTEPDRSSFLSAVGEELGGHRVVVLSGSLPPGLHQDLYGDLVGLARARGVLSVVDAAPDALVAALPRQPDVVTASQVQAQAVVERLAAPVGTVGSIGTAGSRAGDVRADAFAAAFAAARALQAAGARTVLVTTGRHGVAAVHPGGEFWVNAPSVDEVPPIGAGPPIGADPAIGACPAFVAGLAAGLELGETLEQATVRAVASGASSGPRSEPGDVDPARLAALIARLVPQPA